MQCHVLRSLPCVGRGVGAAQAAVVGRQPAHSDAPDDHAIQQLEDEDVPLSCMLAVQKGTCLWIYPDGCGEPDDAELLQLDVGDFAIWRGDFVHAGAGYNVRHDRVHRRAPRALPHSGRVAAGTFADRLETCQVHAYVDPPSHIYRRPKRATSLCCAPRAARQRTAGL